MHIVKMIVNGLECTVDLSTHDTSPTGLRYKLIVTLPKRLRSRRKHTTHALMMRLYGPKPKAPTKPKPDPIGPYVLDIGNALYRTFNFRYGSNPNVTFGRGVTHFTYYFNDCAAARDLGFVEPHFEYIRRNEESMEAAGCPNALPPYRYHYK